MKIISKKITSIFSYLINLGLPTKIDTAIIIGSGLGDFGPQIHNTTTIPYAEIPRFQISQHLLLLGIQVL